MDGDADWLPLPPTDAEEAIPYPNDYDSEAWEDALTDAEEPLPATTPFNARQEFLSGVWRYRTERKMLTQAKDRMSRALTELSNMITDIQHDFSRRQEIAYTQLNDLPSALPENHWKELIALLGPTTSSVELEETAEKILDSFHFELARSIYSFVRPLTCALQNLRDELVKMGPDPFPVEDEAIDNLYVTVYEEASTQDDPDAFKEAVLRLLSEVNVVTGKCRFAMQHLSDGLGNVHTNSREARHELSTSAQYVSDVSAYWPTTYDVTEQIEQWQDAVIKTLIRRAVADGRMPLADRERSWAVIGALAVSAELFTFGTRQANIDQLRREVRKRLKVAAPHRAAALDQATRDEELADAMSYQGHGGVPRPLRGRSSGEGIAAAAADTTVAEDNAEQGTVDGDEDDLPEEYYAMEIDDDMRTGSPIDFSFLLPPGYNDE